MDYNTGLNTNVTIGTKIVYSDPLTNEKYKGVIVRIESWCTPERIHMSSVRDTAERYLIYWANSNSTPASQPQSWICGASDLTTIDREVKA
tara:strand:- start:929 stop:1201 length:273 start_codon:yes stop_codon:yes gene_type:complete